MSAGSGIIHGEFNHSNTSCHLFQMWVMTNEKGGKPYYKIHKPNHFEKWALVVSGNGLENSVQIRQNAKMYAIDSGSLQNIEMPRGDGHFWLQIASGSVKFREITLHTGDAIGFEQSSHFETTEFLEKSRVVLFELH
jgi:redox-sensitive bicupin YhaK (pirin superfamily)